MTEMEKTYDPKDIEEKIYRRWTEKGYFRADENSGKKSYTIVMPPPNITGSCTWDTLSTTPSRTS